ncbi:MAG: class I SAM-dependent methyltransferase [Ferruginibacter sp.]
MDSCIICHNKTGNIPYKIQEMQLGLREWFNYELCAQCGSMQIATIPENLAKYYPTGNYYSFNTLLKNTSPSYISKAKAKFLIYGQFNIIGALMSIGYKMPDYYQWMKNSHTAFNDRILDVGTGNGTLLTSLHKIGFTNLVGIDPFIDNDLDYGQVKVFKRDLFQEQNTYDLIMMHHSLEHMTRPKEVLQKAHSLLADDGRLLVRIPIMGNYGWQTYGIHYSQLDAPRHIFIPSEKGMVQLAEESGFTILKFEYDTTDFAIWSSKLYKMNIPLSEANSQAKNPRPDIFSIEDIMRFRKTAKQINEEKRGDIAAIYMQKK